MSEQSVAVEQPPARPRFRDRLWALKAVIAVALASVIIGGLGGAAIAKAGQSQGSDRFGPGGGGFRGLQNGPGGGRGGFGRHQPNGQRPPTAPSPSAGPSAGQTS